MNPDVVHQLRQALANSPEQRVASTACTTFLDWFSRLVSALELAGVPYGEAQRTSEELITAVLGGFAAGGDAMVNSVVSSAATARAATRH